MVLNFDFDNVDLLPKERRTLYRLRHHHLPSNMVFGLENLRETDLVDYDLSDEKDSFGHPLGLTTVHITAKGEHYLHWLSMLKLKSVALPIIISVATTLLIKVIDFLFL